jgi:hypothetical protein
MHLGARHREGECSASWTDGFTSREGKPRVTTGQGGYSAGLKVKTTAGNRTLVVHPIASHYTELSKIIIIIINNKNNNWHSI